MLSKLSAYREWIHRVCLLVAIPAVGFVIILILWETGRIIAGTNRIDGLRNDVSFGVSIRYNTIAAILSIGVTTALRLLYSNTAGLIAFWTSVMVMTVLSGNAIPNHPHRGVYFLFCVILAYALTFFLSNTVAVELKAAVKD